MFSHDWSPNSRLINVHPVTNAHVFIDVVGMGRIDMTYVDAVLAYQFLGTNFGSVPISHMYKLLWTAGNPRWEKDGKGMKTNISLADLLVATDGVCLCFGPSHSSSEIREPLIKLRGANRIGVQCTYWIGVPPDPEQLLFSIVFNAWRRDDGRYHFQNTFPFSILDQCDRRAAEAFVKATSVPKIP